MLEPLCSRAPVAQTVQRKGVKVVMKRVLGSAAALGCLIAASLLLDTGGSLAASGSRADSSTVNVVEAGSTDFSSADVLFWIDLMKKNGLNVNFNLIDSAATGLKTVISGQADVFIGSLPTAILAVVNAGAPIHVIAANDQASDYIIVGVPGTTVQNSNGKTMGIDTPGSAGQLSAEIGYQKNGVDPSSIKYVTIGGSSARLSAILAGRIDLAPIHYPLALIAEASGKAVSVLDVGKALGPYIQSGLIANDSFTKDNPALAQKVVNAFINAERWAAANKYKYIAYAAAKGLDNGLTGPQEAQTWDYYKADNFFGINGGICDKYFTATVKLNWQLGSIPKPLPVSRDKLIDRSFVKAYLKAHHQKPETC
jgi:ABC-type nitrate/sulfonate/bicarbonate transport system substrate-binding protein